MSLRNESILLFFVAIRLLNTSYDDASRFVKIVSRGQRNFLLPDDLVPMVQDVVDTHPGLGFLKVSYCRTLQLLMVDVLFLIGMHRISFTLRVHCDRADLLQCRPLLDRKTVHTRAAQV